MEARGATASSRKRKSAALESTEQALTRAAMGRPDPRAGEDNRGGVGEYYEEGVDHISALPDDVLGEIISLLSTKEGARTRILASRWRNLWCSAPLNLDGGYLSSEKFAGTVAVILSSHKGPGRRFRTPWHFLNKDNKAAVEACLQSPVLDNLQELELGFSCYLLGQLVPASLFHFSHTLRVAEIVRCTLSDVTVQGLHFPLLKKLGLHLVVISECSLHRLIVGCPALESLLIRSSLTGASCLRINSLCLRRIAVCNDHMVLDELIIESAPCLETLLHLNSSNDLHVFTKLDTLGCTTNSIRLVFGSEGIQGLCIDSLATVVCTIKCFALNMPALSFDMVIQVMDFFPCLEKLYIQCGKRGMKNLWRRKHRDLIKSLDLCLKKLVLLCYYWGRKSDVDFVTFFVLNARVLESMTLVVKNNNEEFLAKQRQKLQLQNMASSGAKFHFTTIGGPSLAGIRSFHDLDLIDSFE